MSQRIRYEQSEGKGRSPRLADVASPLSRLLLAGLLVCSAVLVCAPDCHALSCLDEMIIAGEDEHDDWGCVVDVTPDGRAWVVWTGHDTLDYDEEVYYTIHDSNGWSQPARVHPDNLLDDRSPRLSIGSDGMPWVVWRGPTDVGYGLLASQWSGGGWSPARIVRENVGRWDNHDLLAVDTSDVWLATATASGSYRDVLVYHWDGVEWNDPWQLGDSSTDEHGPDFGIDAQGSPWIVWESRDYETHMSSILCSAWSDTGWTAASVVNGDSGNIGGAQIVFDAVTPLVVWIGNGHVGTGTDLEYSTFEGGSWSPAALASEPDGPDDYDAAPICEVSGTGEIRLCWFAGNSYEFFSPDIIVSQWEGASWGTEQTISAPGTRKADTYPDMTPAPDGGMWSVWMCYHEVAPPWDEDIRGTFCSEATPVSFGALEAVPNAAGTEVAITWYASDEARDGPFHVWRSIATPGSPEGGPEPGESAGRLTSAPITGPPYEWIDRNVTTGTGYLYWVEWTRPHGDLYLGPASVYIPGSTGDLPVLLLYALPNPSTGGARIAYEQGTDGSVGVEIYDVSGRRIARVRAPSRPAGRYDRVNDSLEWDGRDAQGHHVASGVYLVQLTMNGAPVVGQKTRVTVLH